MPPATASAAAAIAAAPLQPLAEQPPGRRPAGAKRADLPARVRHLETAVLAPRPH